MAEADSTMCAGFWTGRGLTPDGIQSALLLMNDQDLDAFMRISMNAALLELNNEAFVQPSGEALPSGIELISSKLGPEDRERFQRVLVNGVSANDEDSCWAMKTLMKGGKDLPEILREPFLRALASI